MVFQVELDSVIFPSFRSFPKFLPRVDRHYFSYPFLDAPPEVDFCRPRLVQQIRLLLIRLDCLSWMQPQGFGEVAARAN